jgi:hypothetical protein
MKFAIALVEGQTEAKFVDEVLSPYLSEKGLYVKPTIVTTNIIQATGKRYKGGLPDFEKIRREIGRLLLTKSTAVTTMFDFYGLPDGFPGKDSHKHRSCYDAVNAIENEFYQKIGDSRFIPYIMLHEFEAMLFVSPESTSKYIPDTDIKARIEKIRISYKSPEEINDGKDTHPSARIKKLVPDYDKTVFGPLITKHIGIDQIRLQCPHFSGWIEKLEQL